MVKLGYPYNCDDLDVNYEVNYEIKLVNETINSLKKVVRKTYKITKVISKCGIVQAVVISFVTIVFAFGLKFGILKPI